MRGNRQSVPSRKGFVSVYMAFSSFLLIPMAGLAIDFSVLYSVKARLQTAVDAAAIGSGTTLNRGSTMDIVAVTDSAQRFFDANYPAHYWGSTPVSPVSITPLQGALGVRTITVNAKEYVPMLFMRVLGINQSTVAATAQVTVRFVNMILVVDRSGSVGRATFNGVATTAIVKANLHAFVDPSDGSASPYFSDGRDNIGMVTFGTSWELDFPMTVNFQTQSPTHIGTTIDAIDYNNNATNTADGLFHAYRQLVTLAQPGALNVIVMLTDGRPSAFSGTFRLTPGSGPCTDRTDKVGVLSAPVSQGWPPPVAGSTIGVYKSTWSGFNGDGTVVANNGGCAFVNPSNVALDFPTFPNSVTPPDDNALRLGPFLTTQATNADLPAFTGAGTNTNSAMAIRYASFNVADNVATLIRSDAFLKPVIFVIGLNNNNGEEALDADWLARVANDKDYVVAATGNHVYQPAQTQGQYFDVNAGGIGAALRQIASEILRLSK